VYYPRAIAGGHDIELVRVFEQSRFAPGPLGVDEPDGDQTAKLADLERALALIPGVAFSVKGDRLGRGGGHYDRLLGDAGGAVTAGLAYSFQMLDELPRSAHDRRLNFIITESAVHPARDEAPMLEREMAEQGGTPRWT
jgi:5-formyltetrahydrofolate cyclo-ligase